MTSGGFHFVMSQISDQWKPFEKPRLMIGLNYLLMEIICQISNPDMSEVATYRNPLTNIDL